MTRIARATLIIALFFGLDKIISFVRVILFNRTFEKDIRDIFFVSNNIPDLLSALISGGALGIALIPVLTEVMDKEGRRAAWGLFARIANLAFLVTASISALIILSADVLVRYVIAPGFNDPEKWALAASLMRLDLLAILIFSISGLVMAGLQANQHFILPAMAPAFYNLGQIIGITVFAPDQGLQLGPITLPAFGLGIYGMVNGVILGALLHLAIQVPGLLRYGFRWTPKIELRNPAVAKVLLLMGPRVLTMLCLHIYFLSRDRFASFFEEGAVSALNNGWFIQQVPETLIGTAIAIALLPSLSEHLVHGDAAAFRDTLNRALRAMLALTLPIAALLAVCIRPLVQLAFDFDPAETELLVWASRAFLLGLTGHAWLETAVRSFYAQQDARTPFKAALVQVSAFILIALILSRLVGVVGIAIADTLTFTTQALWLLWILNRRYPGALRVGGTLRRAVLGAAGGALLAYILLLALPLPPLFATAIALLSGALFALPWIWAEVKMLVRL